MMQKMRKLIHKGLLAKIISLKVSMKMIVMENRTQVM
jgi:hypothetical protein